MKFKSQVLTQASGSIGGVTYSHNAGGMYQRARAIPTNPNTPYQQAVRGIMSQLTSLWENVLTAGQRAAWNLYAANVTLVDALGDPINVSGLNMYVRSNVPRVQTSLPRVDDGPTTFNLGDFTAPTLAAISAATDDFDLGFDNTDDWANEDDAAMIVYGSRPQNAAINYFKGPYRHADNVDGDAVTPPTSPQTIVNPFVLTAGQQVFVKVSVSRADGRLSAPFRAGGIVGA